MTRRILLGAAIVLILGLMAAPAMAQTANGSPLITVSHNYIIDSFGFGIVNETVTFKNNGTTTEQIPSFQIGIPDTITSHSAGFALEPAGKYTLTSSDVNGITVFTIAASSPSLAAGASSTISLESYLTNIINFTSSTSTAGKTVLLLLSPQLYQEVSVIDRAIVLPSSGTLSSTPSGFNASTTSPVPLYTNSSANTSSTYSTETVGFNATDEATFLPVQVFSVQRTIALSTNGVPQVTDLITLRNLANYSVSNIPLTLFGDVSSITVLPSTSVPLINPTPDSLSDGSLSLTSGPFVAAIQAGDNFTFSYTYALPKSEVSTSGTDVSVSVPYVLPLNGTVVGLYSVSLSLPAGANAVGQSSYTITNANAFSQTTITLTYSLAPGSGADQVVPIASAVFAMAFILMVIKRPATIAKTRTEGEKKEEESEEEDEGVNTRLTDLTKSFEDKMALIQTFQEETDEKAQGTVSRADIMKTRSDLDSLKSRGMHRLSEAKQASTSQRYTELLNQITEAAREEDRAAKDLLNLYDQYQTRQMRQETFQRLLPSYKKRLGAATNALSDLLNLVQKEATDE